MSVRLSLLAGDHLQTDGTGLRVLSNPDDDVDSGPFDGQVLYFGDTEHAVYHSTLDKRGTQVTDFLTIGEDDDHQPIVWKGTITADAVSSHDCLFVDGGRIEAGCNAHGLRKFRDDADKAPLLARRAMAFIGRWYHAEEQARDKGLTGDALLRWRRARAGPVANEYRAWLDDHIEDLLPTHPVRKAMQYAIYHWQALSRFLHDPDVPIDNNDSERALRKVALLRNNSMFASDPEGARRYCVLCKPCTKQGGTTAWNETSASTRPHHHQRQGAGIQGSELLDFDVGRREQCRQAARVREAEEAGEVLGSGHDLDRAVAKARHVPGHGHAEVDHDELAGQQHEVPEHGSCHSRHGRRSGDGRGADHGGDARHRCVDAADARPTRRHMAPTACACTSQDSGRRSDGSSPIRPSLPIPKPQVERSVLHYPPRDM